MKKVALILVLYPIFLFSGVFEHLLNKDINYLFEHNFRCHSNICITSEKNIFDNDVMDSSVKVIKAFIDHEKRVFKIEIELSMVGEEREAFFDAIKRSADKNSTLEYKSYLLNDKYGNHPLIDIVDPNRREKYIMNLSDEYYKTMKSYKN
jgi:hypothetical protein